MHELLVAVSPREPLTPLLPTGHRQRSAAADLDASAADGDVDADVDADATECTDGNENCQSWAKRGECDANPKFMLVSCRRSCGQCSASDDDELLRLNASELRVGLHADLTVGVLAPHDVHAHFSFTRTTLRSGVHRLGDLSLRAFVDHAAFHGGASASASPQAKACLEHKDGHRNCAAWAQRGECRQNTAFMLKTCRASCLGCGDDGSGGGAAPDLVCWSAGVDDADGGRRKPASGGGSGGGEWRWRHRRAVTLSGFGADGGCSVAAGSVEARVGVTREVRAERDEEGGAVQLLWHVTNRGGVAVRLVDLGVSMPINQDFAGKTLPEVAREGSFVEPALLAGGGYAQAVRATGRGAVLLLVPLRGCELEAWRPLRGEDATRAATLNENTYEWLFHSSGFAAREWRAATPWNEPTSATLRAGETRTYGLRLLVAPSLRAVESTLLRAGHPVAVPLPGPVIPLDATNASLQLRLPRHGRNASELPTLSCEPESALATQLVAASDGGADGATTLRYALRPLAAPADGRVRLQLRWRNHAAPHAAPHAAAPSNTTTAEAPPTTTRFNLHLFVSQPAARLVAALGRHAADKAWLPLGSSDPWHRDGAFFGWRAAAGRVTDDHRVYMAGLSDESGAAAGLAVALKQLGQPDVREVALLEEYVDETLYQGSHPDSERGRFVQAADGAVRLSMLWWSDELHAGRTARARNASVAAPVFAAGCGGCWPGGCEWMECWSEEHSLESWRAYNYPHVAAVYWALYRLARYHTPALTTRHDWRWYLTRAHATAMAMWVHGGEVRDHTARRRPGGEADAAADGNGTGTAQWGVMVGSVFELVLSDLWREGWEAQARQLQETVERRMAMWLKMPFPYGSEFAWDSTGHEEINTWLLRFGHVAKATQTLDAVTAFASLSAHWAYCGSARRWWDFYINGDEALAANGNERVGHHYAAALNSVVLYDHALHATDGADDTWLWRLACCAGGGTLTNLRADGSASMGLHADPSVLARDAYSGDFGVGFYGHWRNAGAYLTCSAELGWLCVACDVVAVTMQRHKADADADADAALAVPPCARTATLELLPRDAFRRRVFLRPLKLLIEVDGAAVRRVRLTLHPRRAASLELVPVPATSTHAVITLTSAGGDGGGDSRRREMRLRCAAPCTVGPAPFARAPGLWRLQLGSADGRALLEVEDPADA